MLADPHVVAHVYQVVDLRARPDHRVGDLTMRMAEDDEVLSNRAETLAASREPKALGCTSVGFHFRHDTLLVSLLPAKCWAG